MIFQFCYNFAFKFNLRRYNKTIAFWLMDAEMYDGMSTFNEATQGGAWRMLPATS